MKKLLLVLLVFTMGANMYAQEGTTTADDQKAAQDKMARAMELMSQKIEMEVDTELFTSVTANTYVSESPKAVLMAMMIPDSYENTKKKMDKDAGKQFEITEKGETEMNGVNVLYMKGTSEAEGTTLNNTMYCMAIDEETCLMFIGMVDVNADAKYAEAIEKTANSIIKKK